MLVLIYKNNLDHLLIKTRCTSTLGECTTNFSYSNLCFIIVRTLFIYLSFYSLYKFFRCNKSLLTSSLRHPKSFVKEFSYFLMAYHQHCLSVNLLVQR